MKNFGVFQLRESEAEINNIDSAITAYIRKYSQRPNVCYFNPTVLNRFNVDVGIMGVTMKTSPLVHPSMLWVGEED